MKKFILLVLVGYVVLSPITMYGQVPNVTGTVNLTPTQCSNGFDDDGDGLIDYNGGTLNGKKVLKDQECITKDYNCEGVNCTAVSTSTKDTNGFKLDVHFDNPLQVNSIEEAVKKIMDVIIMIAIPVIIVMFIWAGFMYVFAQGDPNAITKAHNIFLYTLLGALLILGAWTIAAAVVGTVNLITG